MVAAAERCSRCGKIYVLPPEAVAWDLLEALRLNMLDDMVNGLCDFCFAVCTREECRTEEQRRLIAEGPSDG